MSAPKRRWYQFSLRTLLVLVVLLAALFSQWPFAEWVEVEHSGRLADPYHVIEYQLQPRRGFLVVLGAEALCLFGWWLWRRNRPNA